MNVFLFNEVVIEMWLLVETQLFWVEYANLMLCG